jgi:hypothetical protein
MAVLPPSVRALRSSANSLIVIEPILVEPGFIVRKMGGRSCSVGTLTE